MKKRFEPESIFLMEEGHIKMVEIKVSNSQMADWSSCLCLLYFNLIECIEFQPINKGLTFCICKEAGLDRLQPSYCRVEKSETILFVSPTELEYWIHFFLQTYRDDTSDVDHIDLEVEVRNVNSQTFTLILKTALYDLPPSTNVQRKRLRIN